MTTTFEQTFRVAGPTVALVIQNLRQIEYEIAALLDLMASQIRIYGLQDVSDSIHNARGYPGRRAGSVDDGEEGLILLGPAPPGSSFAQKDGDLLGRRLMNIVEFSYRATIYIAKDDTRTQQRGNKAIGKAQSLARGGADALAEMNEAMARAFSASPSSFHTSASIPTVNTVDETGPPPTLPSPASGPGTKDDDGNNDADDSESNGGETKGSVSSAFQTFIGVSFGIVVVTAALCLAACCMDLMARFMATNALENARNRLVPLAYLPQEILAYKYSETIQVSADGRTTKGEGDDEDEEHSCCICLCEFEQDDLVRVRKLV